MAWVKIQIVPSVNIPTPTKIGSKMGGAPIPQKWVAIDFDPQPYCRPILEQGCSQNREAREQKDLKIISQPVGAMIMGEHGKNEGQKVDSLWSSE